MTARWPDPDDDLKIFANYDRSCRGSATCTEHRLTWLVTIDLPDPHVCYAHLTADQRAAYDVAHRVVQDRMDRLAREPECWSWPVPKAREYASEEEADEALNNWQRFRGCAICGDTGSLVEDHDHETGLVRGDLCHACNIKEGKGYSTPPFVKYRERHPAAILGVKVRYCSPFFGYAQPERLMTTEEWQQVQAAVDRMSIPLPQHNDSPEDLAKETTDGPQ